MRDRKELLDGKALVVPIHDGSKAGRDRFSDYARPGSTLPLLVIAAPLVMCRSCGPIDGHPTPTLADGSPS